MKEYLHTVYTYSQTTDMCICVYKKTYIYIIYICTCIKHTDVKLHTYIHTYTRIHISLCMYIWVCSYVVHAYIYIYAHACIHAHVCAYMCISMHQHMHIYMNVYTYNQETSLVVKSEIYKATENPYRPTSL